MMDAHNVHHFWGCTPALDLLNLASTDQDIKPVHLLQVAPCDVRHTLTTLCCATRHIEQHAGDVHLHVYEDNAEALARHIILLAIFLDTSMLPELRMQRMLEVFGNVLLRQDTYEYLFQLVKDLEAQVSQAFAKQHSPSLPLSCFDLSQLSYADQDALLNALVSVRKESAFDMPTAWDSRCRQWYADRFDVRRNMVCNFSLPGLHVDWDYHMRLIAAGTPGISEPGSLIHFYHFRHWRLTGVAYEVRRCTYTAPNSTLVSTAKGRTKEFKDRNGADVGRAVAARGLWCDILNGPYHSFGTLPQDPAFYQRANQVFKYTAVDVSEHNVLALMTELQSGMRPVAAGEGADVRRAQAARGPTDMQAVVRLQACFRHTTRQLALQGLQEAAAPDNQNADDNTSVVAGVNVASSENGHNSSGTGSQDATAQAAGCAPLESGTATLSGQAQSTLSRFKIHLLGGDFVKQVAGKRKFAHKFAAATVGNHHLHLLQSSGKLANTLAPGAPVIAESAKYMVQLKPEHVKAFEGNVREWAQEGGFNSCEIAPAGVPDGHVAFCAATSATAAGGG